MARPTFRLSLLQPTYWLSWLGFGVWYVASLLPYRWQMWLGRKLGAVLYVAAKRRCLIAQCNIDLCFPELSVNERERMVRGVMRSLGCAVLETGIAWFWSRRRLKKLYSVTGLEHLQAAKESGQGVIFCCTHFTHIDLCVKLAGIEWPLDGFYRTHKHPVYDYVQRRGREHGNLGGKAIARGDLRAMVRALQGGRAVIYAPDQDYGPKLSVFSELFGVPAATVTATSKLAKLGRAQVIPFFHQRRKDGSGYQLTIQAPLEDFPSSDIERDCRRINKVIESMIMQQPDEYLWVHRRFKTRPEGAEGVYERYGVPSKSQRKKRKQG